MARKPTAPVKVEPVSPEERLVRAIILDGIETDPEKASLARERARAEAAGKAAAMAYKASCSVEVESLHGGGFLHLGDGRKLAFGERAEVPPALAEMLIASGQAK